jgi:hypothetical protein
LLAAGQQHLPGDRRLHARAQYANTVPVAEDIWQAVQAYGQG